MHLEVFRAAAWMRAWVTGMAIRRRAAMDEWGETGTEPRRKGYLPSIARYSLQDAARVAFENCGAIRRFPHRADQAHTPSTHWSSTTNRMIDCESYLESVWMTLLHFDPEVSGFSGQPMQLLGVHDRGSWKATPDLFIRRVDGSATVMEVKNPGRPAAAKVRVTAERVAACCAVAGWGYELVGDPPGRQRTSSGRSRPTSDPPTSPAAGSTTTSRPPSSCASRTR
jgi:hypothetical protein